VNIPIKTNQLKIDLNVSRLAEKYCVFKIETSEKYFSRGAYILDMPLLCNNVCSVYFDSGKRFFVLMLKSKGNKSHLKSALAETDDSNKVTVEEMDMASIDQKTILSLLLNALGSYELDFLRCNNLTGHLYCFHPKWLKRGTRRSESSILKIPCLEIAITNELRLTMAVRTFTSEVLKNQIIFRKRKFEQYPQYILSANNTLRRKLRTDTEKGFILRQTQHDKTEIPFMDIQNLEKFESSKMGIVARVMAGFNKKYAGMCNLSFQTINEYIVADSSKKLVSENRQVVQNLLLQTRVQIVDYIGNDYSSRFCDDVQLILKEKYGIEAAIGKRISKKRLNICVIHNAMYYDGNNDPHDKKHDGVAVQHVTLEDFMGNADAAITTVVHELLIKNDIGNNQISLFDWSSLGIETDISFGMRATIAEEDRYFFMKIRPDGTFDFEEQKLDLFSLNEYTECVNIFVDSKDVVGVVRYSNGDINIIRDTSWFTIPEIEKIHNELSTGNTYLRGKNKRSELLSSITDIKLFDQGKNKYYFVGIIGEGMRTSVSDAVNIRKIEGYRSSNLRFDDLLPLMNVTFVRNGQLTVLPFPFKYLREFIQK